MSQQESGARYGGFWIRVLAAIVDSILLSLLFTILGALFGVSAFSMGDPAAMEAMAGAAAVMQLVFFVVWLAYFAGFTASSLQATPGKLLVRLKVTDADGQRLSILRAIGRELSKIISSLIMGIGYLMVAFTDRKRGLHDMIAGTLVAYRG